MPMGTCSSAIGTDSTASRQAVNKTNGRANVRGHELPHSEPPQQRRRHPRSHHRSRLRHRPLLRASKACPSGRWRMQSACRRAACSPISDPARTCSSRSSNQPPAVRQCSADARAVAATRPAAAARDHASDWFEWVRRTNAGGCVYWRLGHRIRRPARARCATGAAATKPRWRDALTRAIQLAIECGHLRAGDPRASTPSSSTAIPLTVHHEAGLFGYDTARRQAMRAVERWIRSYSPTD